MRYRSLRLRLGIAATALIALALVLAGTGLVIIFDRVLDTRTAADLDRTAKFLAGQVAIGGDGIPVIAVPPPDPRFTEPYGGLYWQIASTRGGGDLRSRSLWDKRLVLPPRPADGGASRVIDLPAPDGGRLLASTLWVTIGHGGAETPLAIAVALDRRDLADSRATYVRLLVPSLAGLGLVLALAMVLFVQRALQPFRSLRESLRAIHDGRMSVLPPHFPEEVQPLVDDLNRSLAFQERALARARTQAGDMAHGLKTPLAVLTALARRTAAAQPEVSRAIEEQAMAMGRQVERSLARARTMAAGDLRRRRCAVAPVAHRVVGALRRLPDAGSLSWEVAVPDTLAFTGDEGDLTEILGALLDNARKWAHRRVRVTAGQEGPCAILAIEDDGPGMEEHAMRQIARGHRWDESKPGTGFGIAIACDVAEETGARIVLGASSLGGLRAALRWERSDIPDGRRTDRASGPRQDAA